MNGIYRAVHWEKQMLRVVALAQFSLKRYFESSCEEGAVIQGNVQGLIIASGWSQDGGLLGR